MKRTVAWLSLILFSFIFSSLAFAAANEDCMQCHSDEKMTTKRKGQTISLYVDLKKFDRSVHKQAGCAGCHPDADVKEFPHPETLGPVKCGACHDDQNKEFNSSIHGKALAKREPYAPTCSECHGNHYILPQKNPNSLTYKMNVPFSAGSVTGKALPSPAPTIFRKKIFWTIIPRVFTASVCSSGDSSSPPRATIATEITSSFPIPIPGRPHLPITSRRRARFAIPRSKKSIRR